MFGYSTTTWLKEEGLVQVWLFLDFISRYTLCIKEFEYNINKIRKK